jgi:DNA repair protein RadC
MGLSLEMPTQDLPRERLLRVGADALSLTEILAILIGTGVSGKSVLQVAQDLLSSFGSLPALADASVEELSALKGLGKAKAIQLKAAFALAKQYALGVHEERPRVQDPQEAYRFLRAVFEGAREERFVVVLLDSKGLVLRWDTVSVGTLNQTLVHPREVFYPAIRHKAASLLIAHNHPSGDPTPSQADIRLTRQLQEAGELLGIPLKDHLVLGAGSYVSLREYGAFTAFGT